MNDSRSKWFCPHMPLGRSMAIITKSYYGALSRRAEKLGIDRHFASLVLIYNTSEKCTQQFLSDHLNIDKVSMVRMLDYLVEKGMIRRVVNPEDRREHIVELTNKGKKIMPLVHQEIDEMNGIALKGLSKKEKEVFLHAISLITANMENLPKNKVDIKLKKK